MSVEEGEDEDGDEDEDDKEEEEVVVVAKPGSRWKWWNSMLPAIPDPIITVLTEEGSAAVVRCACRKLCGGVCQKECVEAGFGSPGSTAGTSSIIGSGGDAASAMVLLLAVVALAVGGRRTKWIGSGEVG